MARQAGVKDVKRGDPYRVEWRPPLILGATGCGAQDLLRKSPIAAILARRKVSATLGKVDKAASLGCGMLRRRVDGAVAGHCRTHVFAVLFLFISPQASGTSSQARQKMDKTFKR